jgi:excisionase family DNA binding protein
MSGEVLALPARPPATVALDRYLNRTELAAHLGCHPRTVSRMVREGMPAHTFGRRMLRFRLREVEAWLEQREAA